MGKLIKLTTKAIEKTIFFSFKTFSIKAILDIGNEYFLKANNNNINKIFSNFVQPQNADTVLFHILFLMCNAVHFFSLSFLFCFFISAAFEISIIQIYTI